MELQQFCLWHITFTRYGAELPVLSQIKDADEIVNQSELPQYELI